jgi:hypothetical protein
MKKTNRFAWFTRMTGLALVPDDDLFNLLPDWMETVLEEPDDKFDRTISEAGAALVESYGVGIGEHIDVWELPKDDMWLMRYWSEDSRFCFNVILANFIDYMMFQTMWLSHTAQKIIQGDQYFAWDQEQRDRHTSKLH